MVLNRRRGLRVAWSNAWAPEFDRALKALPEMESCSHDLYRTLATTPSVARKRFALVSEGRAPVAVVALRARHHHWELLCEGVVPFAAAPAMDGRLDDALAALGVYVRFVEWDGPLPQSRGVRFLERSPRYAVSTRIDFDAYWEAKGNRDWLRKTGRRTAELGQVALEVDGEGAAHWTIDGWHGKWRQDPAGETSATEDIRAAAEHLVGAGRYRTFRLLIDGTPVAGVNTFVRGTTLVMLQSFRDPAYDRAGIGVQLDERIYRWAATSPYEEVDLGCGAGYKERWGDVAGTRATFVIAPAHLALARTALNLARGPSRGSRGSQRDITIEEPATAAVAQQKLDNAV